MRFCAGPALCPDHQLAFAACALGSDRALAVGTMRTRIEARGREVYRIASAAFVLAPDQPAWRSVRALPEPYVPPIQGSLFALDEHRALYLGSKASTHTMSANEGADTRVVTPFVYDAVSDHWEQAGAPRDLERDRFVAAVLSDGTLVVVAGNLSNRSRPPSSVHRFVPAEQAWHRLTDAPEGAACFHAVVLDDDRVFMTSASTAATYIYDARSDRWQPAGNPPRAHQGRNPVRLADGRVALIGMLSETRPAPIDVLDPQTLRWTQAGTLRETWWSPEAILLRDGHVLVLGGSYPNPELAEKGGPTLLGRASTEIWDPAAASTAAGPELTIDRTHPHVLAWPSGRMLVIGGFHNRFVAEISTDILLSE